MQIIICAATRTEASAIRRGIAKAGPLKDLFEVLRVGVGLQNARESLFERLKHGSRPALIISSGYARAVSRDLPLYSWITAKGVLRVGRDGILRDVPVSNLVLFDDAVPTSLATAPGVHPKKFENVSRPVALDLESAALAELAEQYGVPFMVLRLVTDTPRQKLPWVMDSVAAAFARGDLARRLLYGVESISYAVTSPKKTADLVMQSFNWSKLLSDGWAEHAVWLLRGISAHKKAQPARLRRQRQHQHA